MKTLHIVIVFLVVVMIAPVITAGSEIVRQEIKLTRVGENIYLVRCPSEKHTVNVTALTGPEGILLVDAGYKKTAARLQEKIRKLNSGEIKYIINTHHHGDHTGGNGLLGGEATIIAHENARARLLKDCEKTKKDTCRNLPDTTITDSMTMNFSGESIRLTYLPGGHTDGDIIVHFVNANILCTGDMVFADALPHVFHKDGGSVERFIANLDKIISTFPEDITIIPGHGRIYTMADLKKYRDMLADVTKQVKSLKESGKGFEEIVASNVLNQYKDWVSQEFVSDTAWVFIVLNEMGD